MDYADSRINTDEDCETEIMPNGFLSLELSNATSLQNTVLRLDIVVRRFNIYPRLAPSEVEPSRKTLLQSPAVPGGQKKSI